MRASEFIKEQGISISIPINITIPAGGGMPTVGTIAAPAGDEMPDQAVMVPPLQQELELLKQQGGKESPVINQLINQDPKNSSTFVNNETTDEIGDPNGQSAIRDEDESDRILALLRSRRERLDQM